MLPLKLFANRTFSSTAGSALLYAAGFFGGLLVVSLYFQRVRAESAAAAGLHLATITGTFSVTSIITGRIVGRYGSRRPILAGLALLCASAFGLSRLVGHAPFAVIASTLALLGLGAGLVAPPMNAAILASVTPSYAGIGSGVLNASQIGTALGVAVFASFFHAAEPLAAVRLAMISASGLYQAAFLVVALIRDERPVGLVVEHAPLTNSPSPGSAADGVHIEESREWVRAANQEVTTHRPEGNHDTPLA